jgi:hypothetical protein
VIAGPAAAADGRPGDRLARESGRLVDRVSSWAPPAWSAATALGQRGAVVHRLVQQLADLAADAEGQPHRPVPRLDNDAALADQIRVVAADLSAACADPVTLTEAADRIAGVRRSLTRLP